MKAARPAYCLHPSAAAPRPRPSHTPPLPSPRPAHPSPAPTDVTVERIGRLSDADKAALRARMATADEVLARIQRHHAEAGGEITFDEYQALLAALSDTGTVPADRAAHPELQQVG